MEGGLAAAAGLSKRLPHVAVLIVAETVDHRVVECS